MWEGRRAEVWRPAPGGYTHTPSLVFGLGLLSEGRWLVQGVGQRGQGTAAGLGCEPKASMVASLGLCVLIWEMGLMVSRPGGCLRERVRGSANGGAC